MRSSEAKSTPSRGRGLLFGALAAVLAIVLAEAVAFVALWALHGSPRVWSALADARREAVAAAGTSASLDDDANAQDRLKIPKALHPFLGYVSDPYNLPPGWAKDMDPVSAGLGFRNPVNPVEPADDAYIVGIFGGSVADILANQGREALEEAIGRLPAVAGRKVVVLSVASPGYKQPQQVIALNYLLMLGARFDAVVNVDGFNDIALAPTEQRPVGVFPFYPRAWYFMTANMAPSRRVLMGKMAFQGEQRVARAQRFAGPILRRSTTAGLIWSLFDRVDTIRLAESEAAMLADEEEAGFSAKGLYYPYHHAPWLDHLVIGWQRASRQMHHVCEGLGIDYLHLLQPNQYVPGSKPMGTKEREVALAAQKQYGPIIEEGYPKLRAAGAVLRSEGIAFEDATMIFQNEEAQLYRDACCHFFRPGSVLLAEAVAAGLGRLSRPSHRIP